ncbi:MAG: TonB-dependent receptor [Tannerella sp.]|jgi:TonB-linked SusC/RagA family outer membrane protein|nr:TonB-dependent receptor [Tannerella sp.]
MEQAKMILVILSIWFACPAFSLSGYAQTGTVTGIVSDENDEPVIGATVLVVGTSRGTVTDINGRFSIDVSANAMLQISYVGYVTQRISAGTSSTLHIRLVVDETNLEEVVVVGYGTQRKATLTGAISAIKNEELVITKNENVVNMMTGKLPGVRIWQKSAEPGNFDRTKFDIRGFGDPLIIIDGVPQGNEVFNRMDPAEMESISVLKDGTAAIYGVRAANGVILVTTKRGGEEKFKITYQYNRGWQRFLYMPDNVDAIDYMTLTNEKQKRSFDGNFLAQGAPRYTADDFALYTSGQRQSTNWAKETMKDSAPQEQYNLNINGETKKVQYFFNLGYLDQGGILQSGDINYSRWNFRSNNTINILDGLNAQINISGYMDNKNQPMRDLWTIFKAAWNVPPVYRVYANDNPAYYDYESRHDNPVSWQESDVVGFRDNKKRDIQAQGVLEWDIPWVQGLKLKGMYNYHFNHSTENVYNHAFYLYEYRDPSDGQPEQYIGTMLQGPSYSSLQYWESNSSLLQVSLNYNRKFLDTHNVDLLALYEETNGEGYDFRAQRNIELELPYIAAGMDADQRGSGGFPWHDVRKAFVGRLNYDYVGKYLFDFRFRYDGSSRFSPKKQWGFFPGGSIGWRISEESFIKNRFAFVNNLKLRASYGIMGDDGSLNFQHVPGYNYPNNGYIFNGSFVNGVSSRGMINENLTWTTSKTVNYGVDVDLWNGLLGGSLEYFVRNRDGLFERKLAQFPGSVGVGLPQENLNSDRTSGYELSLTHRNKANDINYFINGNITYARSERRYVEQNPFGNSYDEWRSSQRNRYTGIWWGNEYSGQFQSYDQIYRHTINTGGGNQSLIPGDYYYADWNGDGFVDGQDEHPIATYNMPLINFGLSAGANWKGIDANLLFAGSSMFYVRYEEQYHEPLSYGSGGAMVRFLDRWRTVNPDDDIFNPSTQWIPGYYAAMGSALEDGTRAVQNASFIRLKTAELGYSFPKQWIRKVSIDGLRVYINGYNLWTFTGLDNYDPEHPGTTVNNDDWNNGQGGYYYPNNKTYNIGVSITF